MKRPLELPGRINVGLGACNIRKSTFSIPSIMRSETMKKWSNSRGGQELRKVLVKRISLGSSGRFKQPDMVTISNTGESNKYCSIHHPADPKWMFCEVEHYPENRPTLSFMHCHCKSKIKWKRCFNFHFSNWQKRIPSWKREGFEVIACCHRSS